jgi:hypothetical protein
VLLYLIVCPLLASRAGRVFLEKEGCWAAYEVAALQAGSGVALAEAFRTSTLIDVYRVAVQMQVPYCELVLEYSPTGNPLDADKPAYLSIRETNRYVGHSARMNHYSPLLGKHLVRQWEMTQGEKWNSQSLFPQFGARCHS